LQTRNDILSDLGGETNLSTLERLVAEHASLAAAITADGYARWLSGENIDTGTLAYAQGTFLRIAQALGLQRRAKDITTDINTYLEETGNAAPKDEGKDNT
jgi:hypothetical protein